MSVFWAWAILLAAGALEAVWARAMAASNGFRRLLPSLIFLVALALSLLGLATAMKQIPTGAAYAVWVGVGATLTVVWGMLRGEESASASRLGLIALLIFSVVGLKVVS